MKYPRAEWEAKREIIVELYSQSELNLTDIVQKLSEEYGFDATEAMFKKHLCRWGVFKNVIANKRQQLVKVALAHFNAGLRLPTKDDDGNLIPWDRVKRSCLRNGQHSDMWRRLDIPQRKRRRPTTPAESVNSLDRLKTVPKRSKISHFRARYPQETPADQQIRRLGVIRALVLPLNTPRLIQPGSLTPEIDFLLSHIPEFSSWHAAATSPQPPAFRAAEKVYNVVVGPRSSILGDTEREDAAMNILNDFIDLARSLHLGSKTEAIECFNSARIHFSSYLERPSFFVLYAILVIHMLPARDDNLLQSWKFMLLLCFQASAEKVLGSNNPLTRILVQLAADTSSSSSRWSIAILACLANATGPFASEASKFTSLIIRHGLALDLYVKGHPYSAISVLEEIITECSEFRHPLLRKASWSRFHLAEIYQYQGMYTKAKAILEKTVVSSAQIPGGRVLCCYSLFGQLHGDLNSFQKSYGAYRQLYESSCKLYGKEGPLTTVYAQLFQSFLLTVGITIDSKAIEGSFIEMVQTIRTFAHYRLKESPRRYITFASAGIS